MRNPIEEQKNVITYCDEIRLGTKYNMSRRYAASINAHHARENLMSMRKAGLRCVNCCANCSRFWDGQCQLLGINTEYYWICRHFDLYKE